MDTKKEAQIKLIYTKGMIDTLNKMISRLESEKAEAEYMLEDLKKQIKKEG